jgi:Phage integrase, N-terminal SAM-like domain
MLEELERRNYSPGTARCYVHAVQQFAEHFHRAPDQLESEQIREYQLYLLRERKLSSKTVAQRTAALRFFYVPVTVPPCFRLSRDNFSCMTRQPRFRRPGGAEDHLAPRTMTDEA